MSKKKGKKKRKQRAWYEDWQWDKVDVPVSDCPYCGCKRKVVHIHADCYEEPDDYFIEHDNLNDAIAHDCFSEHLMFRSAEDAVKHADMRDKQTCHVMFTSTDGLYTGNPKRYVGLSCGHELMMIGLGKPKYCPVCGAEVV